MKQKNTLTLDKEFILYCELNEIKDINKLATETFNRGFSLLKYGETPMGTTKEVIKEVPVEVIVEKEIVRKVPVEVIKEIIKEVRVEVPIEVVKEGETKTIIKEVPVEIIKEVVDTKQIEELTKENDKLKLELSQITKALDGMNKAKFLKNSNLSDLYDE